MTDLQKLAEFRVEHYAVICPTGELLHRCRTLALAKSQCKLLNKCLHSALKQAVKEAVDDKEFWKRKAGEVLDILRQQQQQQPRPEHWKRKAGVVLDILRGHIWTIDIDEGQEKK